jgi:hypothetical protein
MMSASETAFARSIREQIAQNQLRTPSQRFDALCDLLEVARAMAPDDPEARARRRRALAARQHDREHWREQFRRLLASQRTNASTGV